MDTTRADSQGSRGRRDSHRIAAILVLLSSALPPSASATGNAPIHIPGPNEAGYQITKTESSTAAPAGYQGRTDISSQTAVGNAPATAGRRIVARFQLGNQIRTCPAADGTVEGSGVFSLSVDSTVAQPSGTTTTHIDMRATATYKGQVGDSGYLEGPVNAEIDYSYSLSGTIRDPGGAIATPAGSTAQQHITIPFGVSRGMTPPSFGAFAGGDPTQGHYAEAFGVGAALAYWAGIFYSVAQTRWTLGECAQIVFDPPSNSVQPALGAEVTVKAEIKTKGGQSSQGIFKEVHARSGTVSPPGGPSAVGAPMKFTYKAPNQPARASGFSVNAVSRAGMAEADWNATLGTGWSGQISCSLSVAGDTGSNELQTWAFSSSTRLTVDVKNGTGTANGYGEEHDLKINRRKALRGGSIVILFDQSATTDGTAEGSSPATVEVLLNKARGTYSINLQVEKSIEGKAHTVSCIRENCRDFDAPLYVTNVCLSNGLQGKLSDPNNLEGSVSETRPGVSQQTLTTTWHLARRGTGQ